MATRDEARTALLDAVVKLSEQAKQLGPANAARLLIAASVAYRATEGGPQVGNITIGE